LASLLSKKPESAPCPRGAEHPEGGGYPAPTAEVGRGIEHGEPGWPVGAQEQGLRI